MPINLVLLALLLLAICYFVVARRTVLSKRLAAENPQSMHSLPHYYGLWAGVAAFLPALLLIVFWIGLEETVLRALASQYFPAERTADFNEAVYFTQIKNIALGNIVGQPAEWILTAAEAWKGWQALSENLLAATAIGLSSVLGFLAYRQVDLSFRARNAVESVVMITLVAASGIAILTTVGIVFSVVFESIKFFGMVSPWDFLFGLEWIPQVSFGENAGSGRSAYGAVPLFAGTALISVIALLVAVPAGLFSAIFLSEYAGPRLRAVVKPMMEILAGIPTVVYGFFAALTVAPLFKDLGAMIGLSVSSESALAAGVVMGVMIIPFVSSLSDDVINAVPQSLRDAAYGLGSTKSEAIKQVILPAALPGIVGAILLAISRAVGETMIVVMAAGLAANLSANPLDAVTTVTVQIVTILKGDQSFNSPITLSAFALALTLITVTLALNVIAVRIVKKYREQYD